MCLVLVFSPIFSKNQSNGVTISPRRVESKEYLKPPARCVCVCELRCTTHPQIRGKPTCSISIGTLASGMSRYLGWAVSVGVSLKHQGVMNHGVSIKE